MKHDALCHRLASHLAANADRMIWVDMQLGPSGSPRPDVYTILKSYTRPLPTAYECKVSVEDFRGDVTSGKWQEYLRFAGAVIFCTPKGLIGKKDLPNGCGLIQYDETRDTFGHVKGATHSPVNLPQDAILKLLIDGVKKAQEPARVRYESEWQIMKRVREKVGAEVEDFVSNKARAEARLGMLNEQIAAKETTMKDIGLLIHEAQVAGREEGEKQASKLLGEANKEWSHLCETLGLPPSTDKWSIYHVVAGLRENLQKEPEVQRLMALLQDIAHDINKAANHPSGTVQPVDEIKL